MSRNARVFEVLMYLALAIGVTLAVFPSSYRIRPAQNLAFNVAWWVLVVCLIWFTARRAKNWARWTLAAMFLWQTGQMLYSGWLWRFDARVTWYYAVITALEIVAYYHIFTGDGAAQFRRPRVDSVFS